MNNMIDPALSEKFSHEKDKVLKEIFRPYIKGSFLIKIMHSVYKRCPEFIENYNLNVDIKRMLTGHQLPDYDVCRLIIGCHSSNIIFLSDAERVEREKNENYQNELVQNVIEHIKLRGYGSAFFRQNPLIPGEMFITYNVPYNLFAMIIRCNDILNKELMNSVYRPMYCQLSKNSLAILTLLEDGFFQNCYSVCRALIEQYTKFLIFKMHPNVLEWYDKFCQFEFMQTCCDQKYPEEFNTLYNQRKNERKPAKNEYLHYGWVDQIEDYHEKVNQHPYSLFGILNYLQEVLASEQKGTIDLLRRLHKLCHGYVHGTNSGMKYPLQHYFEISIMLHMVIVPVYEMLCAEAEMETQIQGVDILKKATQDFEKLFEQYNKRSTENFEAHYKNKKHLA